MMKLIFQAILLFVLVANITAHGQAQRGQLILPGLELWALNSESNDFYGLFMKIQLTDDYYEFEVRKINIKDYAPGLETVDSEKVKKDKLMYVLLGFDSLSKNIRGWSFQSNHLLPGQSLLAGLYHIYAKGDIVETKDSTSWEVFDQIDNYRIGLKTHTHEKVMDQLITEGYTLTRWNVGDYLGGTKVDWVGDLNGDGRLEIIMTATNHHECFHLILYSPDKNYKIREVYRNTVCGG